MNAKYDSIAGHYNQTRKADPYLLQKLYDKLDPQSNEHYLDVGCGSGNYSLGLIEKGVQLDGVDPSEEMLKIIRSKAPQRQWTKAKVEELPFPDAHFNGGTAFLTIHHWDDLIKGFAEIHRICKKGARFILFSSCSEQMQGYWLRHYFPEMMDASIQQMPSFIHILEAILHSGLKVYSRDNYFVKPDLQDLFLYNGKEDPERYFDAGIRAGISSFSNLCSDEELNRGLTRLRSDIDGGEFEKIKQENEHEEGDYYFLTLFK